MLAPVDTRAVPRRELVPHIQAKMFDLLSAGKSQFFVCLRLAGFLNDGQEPDLCDMMEQNLNLRIIRGR
ncbi:MAG: hypothetical protein DMG23_11235 [Acidobacteria bacterium]|nr:MAG: hypothetical protein DMG23_11235 [Acidobacteriota bacterium]